MTELTLHPPRVRSLGRSLLTLAALGAAVLVVAAPAIWNGFPLLYPDTGGYLTRPFEGTLELGRSALYGVFLAAGIPTFFWINIAVQAAIVVWLMTLTLRVAGLGDRPWLVLAITATLALVSGLAWYAAMLLPDIWLSAAVLALYLLGFHAVRLTILERTILVAVVAFAAASHMGTLGVTAALVVALTVLRLIPARLLARWPRPTLKLPALAIAAGIALALVSNFAIAGKFKFTPGGDSFMFGRLIQDGIVARYLEDRCPDPAIRLCAYRDKLPTMADDWLWAPGNLLSELGGWRAFAEEERRITLETVRMYPVMHVIEAAKTTGEQLLKTKTEVSLVPDWLAPTTGTFKDIVPQMTPTMFASRQYAAPFPQLIEAFNTVHVPIAAISVIGLLALLLLPLRLQIPPAVMALALTVCGAVLINAFICGTFSNPVDRYESRLIWLAPFALMIAGLTLRRRPAHTG
jgi:hypothetical protein